MVSHFCTAAEPLYTNLTNLIILKLTDINLERPFWTLLYWQWNPGLGKRDFETLKLIKSIVNTPIGSRIPICGIQLQGRMV